MQDYKNKSEDFWKNKLSNEQYKVLREKGTEVPFSGALYNNKSTGMYACVACGQDLFSSDSKYDSGCGWPSFDNPINSKNVLLLEDSSLGMARTEVQCSNCNSHLGHVFNDGPKDTTGLRYCINSVSLDFRQV